MAESKYTRILFYITYAPVVLVPAFYVLAYFVGQSGDDALIDTQFMRSMISFVVLFVANMVMIRRLFIRKHRMLYFVCLALLFTVFTAFTYYNDFVDGSMLSAAARTKSPRLGPNPFIVDLFIGMLILSSSLAIDIFYRYMQESKRNSELEKERMSQELSYLRAQLDPHFAMNMLNNIHGLVETEPAKAQDMIMELSRLMRYVLYEGTKKLVPLSTETDFLRSYIKVISSRYSDKKLTVTTTSSGVKAGLSVPPLLFFVLVENAFKHGVSYWAKSEISMSLDVKDGFVTLRTHNYKKIDKRNTPPGIGLSNLRRRLDLLFGNRYTLEFTEDADSFSAMLKIPANEAN